MTRLEELISRAQTGDDRAMELLVEENSGLIWAVVRRFLNRGAEADDLYQLGCLGFLKAVEGFDLQFGTQFSTYAVPKISGEIRRFLRDDGAVKVSRTLKERSITIRSARNRLATTLGREPSLQEISRQTGFSAEEIALAETATAATESSILFPVWAATSANAPAPTPPSTVWKRSSSPPQQTLPGSNTDTPDK